MPLILKLDCTAGSPIKEVIEELCTIATRIGVPCEAVFNGVTTVAEPSCHPITLYAAWLQEVNNDKPVKVVIGRAFKIDLAKQ